MVKKTNKVLKRSQERFLRSIVEHIIDKPSAEIVNLLLGKRDVNEFLIAKKLELTINQTRNILYKLSDYGLVSFIRKKDKRKGWYIYFWTLNVFQSLNLLEQKLKSELEKLQNQRNNRSENRYYVCDTCSLEVTEEVALLNDFTCSECEEVYTLANQDGNVVLLEKEIARIKRDLAAVAEERGVEGVKVDKRRERKVKKAELERKEKRAQKRLERQKLLAKEGKLPKKKKKKVVKKKKKVVKKGKKAAKKTSKKATKKVVKKTKKKKK